MNESTSRFIYLSLFLGILAVFALLAYILQYHKVVVMRDNLDSEKNENKLLKIQLALQLKDEDEISPEK